MSSFDPAAPVVVQSVAIVRADTTRAEQVLEAAINLDRSVANNAFTLGDYFAEIMEGDYWAADHCESMPDFLKKHGFELSIREVQARAKVSRVSKKLEIPMAKKLKAKMSKMKLICELLDPEADYHDDAINEDVKGSVIMLQLVDRAPQMTVVDLKKEIAKLRNDPENEMVHETIAYTAAEKVFIDDAIERVRQVGGDTVDPDTGEHKEPSRGSCYVVMAVNLLQDPNFKEQIEDEDKSEAEFEDEHFVEDDEGNLYETGAE